MKTKVIIILGVAGLLSFSAFKMSAAIHSHGDPETKAKHHIEMLTKKLSLTAEQQTALKTMLMQQAEQMKAAKAAANGDREQMRETMKALKAEKRTAMEAILTPEQLEQLHQMKRGHHGKKHGRRGMHSKIEAMKEQLLPEIVAQREALENQLSEEEKAIIVEMREKVLEIKKEALDPEVEHPFAPENMMKRGMHESKKGMHHKQRHHGHAANESQENMREEMRAKMKAMKEKNASEEEWMALKKEMMEHHMEMRGLSEEEKVEKRAHLEERMAMHQELKEALEPLHVIAENHEETLEASFNTIHEKAMEMHGDMPMMKHHLPIKEMAGKHMQVFFLLMDVSNEKPTTTATAFEVKTFPNPASNSTTIEFEIKQEGQVLIELLDKAGNVVQTIMDAPQTKGTHQVVANLSRLSNNTFYIVAVTTPAGTVHQKLFIR